MEPENMDQEKQSSIALKRSTKGVYSWDIKIYFKDNDEAVLQKIKDIDSKLKQEYPLAPGA